jgi:glycosyltransferase involved in cell wall biosynthesis
VDTEDVCVRKLPVGWGETRVVKKDKTVNIIIIGPTPPPYNGMSVATEMVKAALKDGGVGYLHLDTADRRGIANIGRLELGNVWRALWHGLRFAWILVARRPQVVYVPIAQSGLPFMRDCLFLVPARVFGRKVVIHLHGGYFGKFYAGAHPMMRRLVRYAIGRVSCAVVLGEMLRGVFDGVVPRSRIRVVPNGIPDWFADTWESLGRACKGGAQGNPTVFYVGALMREKGVLDLIRALHGVVMRGVPVRAVFAGEWYREEDRVSAQALVENCGLTNVVRFVGPVGFLHKKMWLQKADVFALPSFYEGQPYSILEAMSAGLPVISTTVGCIPETVRDGVEGFLIDPGDVEALTERLTRLVLDPVLREQMGRAARQRFLKCYTYERFAEDMRSIFMEVLEKESGGNG